MEKIIPPPSYSLLAGHLVIIVVGAGEEHPSATKEDRFGEKEA